MKTKTVLAVAIISGVGLAGTFAYFLNSSPQSKTAAPQTVTPGAPARRADRASNIPRFFTNTVNVDWNQVESADYKNYIANLRAIGCPEETIRDIIVADVNKLFEAREKALAGPEQKFEFWKRQSSREALGEDKVKQRIQLAREKRALLKELLGVEIDDKTPLVPSPRSQEGRLAFLPQDKQQQVREVEATFTAKVNSLFANTVRPTREDLQKYNELQAEQRSELAKMLSPQEMEDYELRSSQTAQMMRSTLGDFEMSEQEFRDVFRLKKEFDDAYGFYFGPNAEDPQKAAGRVELEKRIRSTLGEERYAEYNREQNWAVSTLRQVARDYGIPKETAVKVFDIKLDAQDQASKVRLDPSLNEQQQLQALKGIQDETVKAIGGLIGPEAAGAYHRQGSWIRNLGSIQPEPQSAAGRR